MIERGPEQVEELLRDLQAARGEFMAALADVEPDLLTAPGLVGEWSARELIAHLGYWTGRLPRRCITPMDRTGDFGEDEHDVDERNAIVARVAAETDWPRCASARRPPSRPWPPAWSVLTRPGWTRRSPTATVRGA